MILYFSGTGNSAHAAKYIGREIGDEVVDLFDKLRNNDYSPMTSYKPWIIVAPVYCWQLPKLVSSWIQRTEFIGSKEIYFVLTCGSDMGNAEKYLKELCNEKGFDYKGAAPVVMPENYIAVFEAPDVDEAEVIMKKADRTLGRIIRRIRNKENLPPVKVSLIGRLSSGIVNKIYYPLIVKDKKFYATGSCTDCGLCEKKCPLGNIRMVDGKPSWNGNCTHCMACIAYCPAEAIEYGNASKGKRRYTCD